MGTRGRRGGVPPPGRRGKGARKSSSRAWTRLVKQLGEGTGAQLEVCPIAAQAEPCTTPPALFLPSPFQLLLPPLRLFLHSLLNFFHSTITFPSFFLFSVRSLPSPPSNYHSPPPIPLLLLSFLRPLPLFTPHTSHFSPSPSHYPPPNTPSSSCSVRLLGCWFLALHQPSGRKRRGW